MNDLLIQRSDRNYLIQLKMFTDPEERIFNFTELIELVQFNSPELVAKILRDIHHSYSILNIREMSNAINTGKLISSYYSESVPNELHYLRELANRIEKIKPVKIQVQ